MPLSLRKNGLTSLFKEVRVFKVTECWRVFFNSCSLGSPFPDFLSWFAGTTPDRIFSDYFRIPSRMLRIRLPGQKPQNQEKRVSESKKPPFPPPPQKRASRVKKIPIFPVVPCIEWGFFDSRCPFSGVGGNGFFFVDSETLFS